MPLLFESTSYPTFNVGQFDASGTHGSDTVGDEDVVILTVTDTGRSSNAGSLEHRSPRNRHRRFVRSELQTLHLPHRRTTPRNRNVCSRSAPPAISSSTSAATLRSVSKLFGTFVALRRCTLTLAAGSSTVLLGENGAGKSTLLRLLSGLSEPTQGDIEVLGGNPRDVRHRIAYVSHSSGLYDELTAMENLRYFASLHRTAGISCACSANPEMALRAVGLDPTLTRPVGQYSQGMRQRASLALALQADPDLLLLDEPFSNLDVSSSHAMVELLADFRTWPSASGAHGRTLVLTTHQASLAHPLADRTITMSRGEILSDTDAPASATR